MEELHLIFKGKVQGVGFRWTVVAHAETFNLKGFVRNLGDGNVEALAQGTKEELEKFLQALQQDPGHAQITAITAQYCRVKEFHPSFRILS